MLDCENQLATLGVDLRWSRDLVPLLGAKMDDKNSITEQDLTGISDLITHILMKYPTSEVVSQLQEATFIQSLLRNSIDDHVMAMHYMNVLLRVMSVCRNQKEYETTEIKPLFVELLQLQTNTNNNNTANNSNSDSSSGNRSRSSSKSPRTTRQRSSSSVSSSSSSSPSETPQNTDAQPQQQQQQQPPTSEQQQQQQEKPLQKLCKLLYKPPANLPTSIDTSAGVIAPLGHYRLRCVQFVLSLVRSNYHLVDNALIEHRILSRCVDLFFQFKWNNILHSLVEVMCLHILETKPPYLCLYLLRDCSLVDRILQAVQNEEQEKKMKGKKEQG